MRKTLLSLLVGASLLAVSPASAQEGHKMENMKGMEMPAMTSPLASFKTALAEAEKAAAAKNLEIMHKYSETMTEALTSLQKTDAAKDPLVASALTQAIPVAKSLDTVGDAGDLPGTLSVLKKLQGVDAVLKARLPAPMDHNTLEKHGRNNSQADMNSTIQSSDQKIQLESDAEHEEPMAIKYVEAKYVCMINNTSFDTVQIPVEINGATYYGCCPMCKEKLISNPKTRIAIDPVSGKSVDKAKAIIGAAPDKAIYYFENEENMQKFNNEPSRYSKPAITEP